MSAVGVLSTEEDSMNMCGRGNGKCKSLLVVVWLFLALGWIGTGGGGAGGAVEGGGSAGGHREGLAGRGDVHGAGRLVGGNGETWRC